MANGERFSSRTDPKRDSGPRDHWKTIAVINMACTLVLTLVVIWTIQRQSTTVWGKVRVHRIEVVDDAGKERIVIAAPLKEGPIVNGRDTTRRVGVSAAIQFKEVDGTERGGIALEDDGSFMFGVDDEQGHERAHIFYIPQRGSGIYLQSPKAQTVSLIDPPADKGGPSLKILSNAGQTFAEWPLPSK